MKAQTDQNKKGVRKMALATITVDVVCENCDTRIKVPVEHIATLKQFAEILRTENIRTIYYDGKKEQTQK